MKVAISSKGEGLDSEVDPRFGRCITFIIVDTEAGDHHAIPNEGMNSTGGAGISAAQLVVNEGAEAVITGNIGPNAQMTLSAAGIKVYTGAAGIVGDALEKLKKGELAESGGPTVGSHHGMGGGGMGRGMGRGGGGGGRGRGI